MKYVEYGLKQNNTIMLLHGGGLAPWNYYEEARQLQNQYHVIVPVLDGHSGSDKDFTTIENNADEIITYIGENFEGRIFMICGLSLGGQILTDILAKRKDICKYAIIESALVFPMRTTYALIQPTFSICYPLIKKQWFAKLQFKSLRIKESFFEDYYRDSAAITKENLIAFLKANSDYKLKESIKESQAKVLILVGEKESRIMEKSAEFLCEQLPNSTLEVLPKYYHGELSIHRASEYVQKIEQAMFISPIVNMERIIADMMMWSNVTEAELESKKEIPTEFGETLSWEYLCYVRKHPIKWSIPTCILYGENDHLTSRETISGFADRIGADLAVMEDGEHWFHTAEQMKVLDHWISNSTR